MGRAANPDIRANYTEALDPDSPAKCLKVKCIHCGFTRAKNTTRQVEHLLDCPVYLKSPEAQHWLAERKAAAEAGQSTSGDRARRNQSPAIATATLTASDAPDQAAIDSARANPNLKVARRGPPVNKRRSEAQQTPRPHPTQRQPVRQPSLTAHLSSSNRQAFQKATRQQFLSHAGCGTLSSAALSKWMGQDGHKSRAQVQFVGALIAKIRLPAVPQSQFHPLYRTLDLLISAVNNIRREMGFFENTASKYNIGVSDDPPNPVTRAYIDLFNSVANPGASLLEGMVLLWTTGNACRASWQYAQTFTSALSRPPTDSHNAALHHSLIPNWTSPAFAKFVDACGAIVDDLANTSTTTNGREEMTRCDQVFKQICWLEARFWPGVDGMGEEVGAGKDGIAAEDSAEGGYERPVNGLREAVGEAD